MVIVAVAPVVPETATVIPVEAKDWVETEPEETVPEADWVAWQVSWTRFPDISPRLTKTPLQPFVIAPFLFAIYRRGRL